MFKKFRRNSAAFRLLEEQLYEQVFAELASGEKREGLWAKAFAHSEGSEEKTKALYVQYRVQSLKDEMEISGAINEEKTEMEFLEAINQAAESDATKRFKSAEDMLNSKGYKLRTKGYGWVVIEPLGGRQRINSLEELERYAKSYP